MKDHYIQYGFHVLHENLIDAVNDIYSFGVNNEYTPEEIKASIIDTINDWFENNKKVNDE